MLKKIVQEKVQQKAGKREFPTPVECRSKTSLT